MKPRPDSASRRQILTVAGSAALGAALPGLALAQSDWPNRPIRFFVPFPAGGGADLGARVIAAHMGKITLKVDTTQTGTRGPVQLRMQTGKHGELSCRINDVAGSEGRPISPQAAEEKFRDCFLQSRWPVTGPQYDQLRAHMDVLHEVDDMYLFLKDIL